MKCNENGSANTKSNKEHRKPIKRAIDHPVEMLFLAPSKSFRPSNVERRLPDPAPIPFARASEISNKGCIIETPPKAISE